MEDQFADISIWIIETGKLKFSGNIFICLIKSSRIGCIYPEDMGLRIVADESVGVFNSYLRFSSNLLSACTIHR
jgi:hypothetical protein